MQTLRSLAVALAALAAPILAGAMPAVAQDAACPRLRAELASLGRGGGSARSEAAQLSAYYRAAGCEGGQFLFFDTRPPQCAPIAQRISILNAMAANGSGDEERRRELRALIAARCSAPRPERAELREPRAEQTARGGGQVICVRTCDGGFFPMGNLPDGREGADEMCRALCPGTEAVAYSMPSGDDPLREAAAVRDRRAYTALPNAFKFRTSYTPSCSCRGEGQTWSQALARAEKMLDRYPGDIVVTAARAAQMSRPRVAAALPETRRGKVAVSLGDRSGPALDAAVTGSLRGAPAGTAPAGTAPGAATGASTAALAANAAASATPSASPTKRTDAALTAPAVRVIEIGPPRLTTP